MQHARDWLRACLTAAADRAPGVGPPPRCRKPPARPRKRRPDVGEIVVTATRKEESLSKVPESVSAFTAAKMEIQGIKSFADVAKFTSGVTFNGESHDISVRGISSTAGSGTTGIYIDDHRCRFATWA